MRPRSDPAGCTARQRADAVEGVDARRSGEQWTLCSRRSTRDGSCSSHFPLRRRQPSSANLGKRPAINAFDGSRARRRRSTRPRSARRVATSWHSSVRETCSRPGGSRSRWSTPHRRIRRRDRVFGSGFDRRPGQRDDPFFKPEWDPELLLSINMLGTFSAARRRLDRGRGRTPGRIRSRAAYDLMLRASEQTPHIERVAKVLCHLGPRDTTRETIVARHRRGATSAGHRGRAGSARTAWLRRDAVHEPRTPLLHDAIQARQTPAGLHHHPDPRSGGTAADDDRQHPAAHGLRHV